MSGELVQKNYVAGNLTIKNRFVRNPNRYYQEDFFDTLPIMETIPEVNLDEESNSGTLNSAAYSHTRKVILLTKNSDDTGISITANSTSVLYTLFNNLITEESNIIFNIKDQGRIIANPATAVDNTIKPSLSVVIKKIHNGYVEFSIRNDTNAVFPSTGTAIHKILCSIDPQISINKNWSLKGTGALETNVFRAEGALGTGILMSTGMTGSNTYKDNQCILHPKHSNNVFNYNHIMVKAKASHDLNVNSTNASIQVIVTITGTGITNVKHNATSVYSNYFKVGHPVYKAITSTDTAGSNGYIMIGILSKITAAGAEPSFHFENTGLLAPLTQGDILFPNNIIPSISMDRFWSVSSQLEFECCIRTPNVLSNFCFWAGWKLTTDSGLHTTDNNQAYFFYDSSGDTLSGTGNSLNVNVKNKLFFVYSIDGSDNPKRITQIKITGNAENDGVLLANTVYKLRIIFNKDRTLSIYADKHLDTHSIRNTNASTSTQVSLDTDSLPKDSTQFKLLKESDEPISYTDGTFKTGSTYGNPIGSNELSSLFNSDAMNEKEKIENGIVKNYVSINYLPVIGVQNVGGSNNNLPTYLTVSYIKCSKLLTEDDTDYRES